MVGRNLLTTGQVARELGVTINTVKSWIREGKLAGLRLPSGHYRIPHRELERLEAETTYPNAVAASSAREEDWLTYEEWRQDRPLAESPLDDVLTWVDLMLRVARAGGPLPHPSLEERAARVLKLHRALQHIRR